MNSVELEAVKTEDSCSTEKLDPAFVDKRGRKCPRLKVFLCLAFIGVIFLVLLIVLLSVLLPIQSKRDADTGVSDQMDCDVAIAGGGLSGLYMAYRLLKDTDEKKVCLFEKESRLGGRVYDFSFDEAPNISIGLGGWRIGTNHRMILDLIRELELETYEWTFKRPSMHEARGIFSEDMGKFMNAYPALRDSKFGNMSRRELFSYVWNDTTDISDYSTVNSFVSHRITPEGTKYMYELSGYKGSIEGLFSPVGYLEAIKQSNGSGKYVRPVGGLSSIVTALIGKLEELGADIYTDSEVRKIEKDADTYQLYTTRFNKVTAGKVVVAIPPLQFQEVRGAVSKQLQDSPEFQSVGPVPVMKGAALFSSDTWSNLTAHKTFVSDSDCLGLGFLYMGSGVNDEDVLHTIYVDGHCSNMWKGVQTLGKDVLDKEVHRALEYKYRRTIPKPLGTVYKYWDGAWHVQRSGTNVSMANVGEWAVKPLQGEDVFVVGEAYAPVKRGWCEAVMHSCSGVLRKGWGIKQHVRRNTLRKTGLTQKELIEYLRRIDEPLPLPF